MKLDSEEARHLAFELYKLNLEVTLKYINIAVTLLIFYLTAVGAVLSFYLQSTQQYAESLYFLLILGVGFGLIYAFSLPMVQILESMLEGVRDFLKLKASLSALVLGMFCGVSLLIIIVVNTLIIHLLYRHWCYDALSFMGCSILFFLTYFLSYRFNNVGDKTPFNPPFWE